MSWAPWTSKATSCQARHRVFQPGRPSCLRASHPPPSPASFASLVRKRCIGKLRHRPRLLQTQTFSNVLIHEDLHVHCLCGPSQKNPLYLSTAGEKDVYKAEPGTARITRKITRHRPLAHQSQKQPFAPLFFSLAPQLAILGNRAITHNHGHTEQSEASTCYQNPSLRSG